MFSQIQCQFRVTRLVKELGIFVKLPNNCLIVLCRSTSAGVAGRPYLILVMAPLIIGLCLRGTFIY